MENIFYQVVTQEMVWVYYYDEYKNKHFLELLGKQARQFIEDMQNFSQETGKFPK